MTDSHAAPNETGRLCKAQKTKVCIKPGDALGAGDTLLHTDLLPPDLADGVFTRVKEEVAWNVMHHRGGELPRLVAVQGDVAADGSFPVYRHPADESPELHPFTPTVQVIRERVQRVLSHPVNHVLIQLYRGGNDYISEHSDKTVDVAPGSSIVNVSLGAQRTMTLRTKKDVLPVKTMVEVAEDCAGKRDVQRIPLPHNSMLAMGLATNREWLHAIRADKRPVSEKTAAELAEGGARISLTFRCIHTFLSADERFIWGAGAHGKTQDAKRPVVYGDVEAEALLAAFGEENHSTVFDWQATYGDGFDVLHFRLHDTIDNVPLN
ncbi:hypothetical protein K488DRAFT_57192 [Vararia minispora EC-137]|uniref:Uncharacterized protein n=1 Tax=Vararia minispora EC-137 TaxID=1314806 RepID=A0ACB8QBG1_9AGAM|nr:hypothetical protein K488DRAFT_57192 [Vararia minispora EC-137]